MSYQPTTLESRRIMTETIKTLLEPIQNRLNAATPGPWKAENLENSHGHRGIYWVSLDRPDHIMTVAEVDANDNGVEAVWKFEDAEFIANAPTDQARLLAAVQAVVAVADLWEEDFPHKAWQIRSALSKALSEAR